MAIEKASGETILTDATLPLSTATALSSNVDLSKATSWVVTITATFNASATDGLRLTLWPSYDGSTFDTVAWDDWYWDMDVNDAGNVEVRTSPPLSTSPKGCKIKLTNLDSTYAVTSIVVRSIKQTAG